jgi:hypothetical protein
MLINQNMAILANLNRLYSASSAEVLRQTRVVHPDGSILERNEIVNPRDGGILAKLFSSPGSEKPRAEAEEAPPQEKKTGAAYMQEGAEFAEGF